MGDNNVLEANGSPENVIRERRFIQKFMNSPVRRIRRAERVVDPSKLTPYTRLSEDW